MTTVLYGDLFEYPLTVDEIHRFLTAQCPDRAPLEQALAALDGRYLRVEQDFVCWRGHEASIETRRRRQQMAAARWPPARRFARWLSWVPFLRMVAVCGSQAMENGDEDGDVDFFLITAPRRLWLVQSLTMTLRRAGRWLGIEICPNYLMSADTLEIEARNLYTARETAQVMPLWGEETYQSFLEANRWVEDFLPQARLDDRSQTDRSQTDRSQTDRSQTDRSQTDRSQTDRPLAGRRRFLEPRSRHRLTSVCEWVLGGWLGDGLDRIVHRALLLYYRLRLRRHGWGQEKIERAYRRDRQVVVTGGYAGAVARRFIDRCAEELGDELSRDEIRRRFFGDPEGHRRTESQDDRQEPDPLYTRLMATRYGGGR